MTDATLLHEFLLAAAKVTPDKPAVAGPDTTLIYRQLERLAHDYACELDRPRKSTVCRRSGVLCCGTGWTR